MGSRVKRARSERHSQTPIIRGQIKALRAMVEGAAAHDVGEVLAVNMVAAFALELALKLFYMTFHDEPPPVTHSLKKLWEAMPPKWQDEIARAYQNDPRSKKDLKLIALQRAPSPPAVPAAYQLQGMATAEGLISSMSEAFEHARYFYEKVEAGRWAHVDHPIHQMLAMIDVLTAFYEHLLKEASKSDA